MPRSAQGRFVHSKGRIYRGILWQNGSQSQSNPKAGDSFAREGATKRFNQKVQAHSMFWQIQYDRPSPQATQDAATKLANSPERSVTTPSVLCSIFYWKWNLRNIARKQYETQCMVLLKTNVYISSSNHNSTPYGYYVLDIFSETTCQDLCSCVPSWVLSSTSYKIT